MNGGKAEMLFGDTQHFTLVSINKCSHVKQASIFLENDQFIFRYNVFAQSTASQC